MKKAYLLSLYFVIMLCWGGSVLGTEERPALGLSGGEYPLVHTPTQIMVSHASYPDLKRFKVTVTYRANSSTAYQETLEAPNEDGYVSWTPREAGITILNAEAPDIENPETSVKIEKSVSVRFGSFPPAGLLIFALATLILFGGLSLLIYSNTKPPITN